MPQVIPIIPRTVKVSPINRDQKDDDTEKGSDEKMAECMKEKPYEIIRPLFISMTLFGLTFVNCKKGFWYPITKVYATIVLMILWANFIRCFFTYAQGESFGPELVFKLINHCWSLFAAVCVTTTYKACKSDKRLTAFLVQWRKLSKSNGASPVEKEKYESMIKRSSFIFLAFGWLGLIINEAFLVYTFFITEQYSFVIAPVSPSDDFAFPMKCIVFTIQSLVCIAWAFTLCLFFLISTVIYLEFELLHQDFRKSLSPDGEIDELEYFRRRHQEICHLVETADDILNLFNAFAIVLSTAGGMLILYSLLFFFSGSPDVIVIISCSFWLVSTFGYLILVCYGGGYLNHAAHSPLKVIHDIRLNEVSTKVSLQMNMFLTKLTGESIGLTAMDMFVIDKPTILTIAGAFITYFIVLIQFQQPTSSPAGPPVCNYTGFVDN